MSNPAISTKPAPPGFSVITEGKASVVVPVGNKVFYNNVQEFNRDMSICVLSTFSEMLKAEADVKAQKWVNDEGGHNARKRAKLAANGQTDHQPPRTMETVPSRLRYNGLRIFEALSASGLRSIRYFKEVPMVDTIHVNDMDPSAVASIQRNIMYNELPLDKVIPNQNDATAALYMNRARQKELLREMRIKPDEKITSTVPIPDGVVIAEDDPMAWLYKPTSTVESLVPHKEIPNWNVVDLDPYGSAAPFLDAAIQAVESGGLLCVTCTDSGVLCGGYSETCFAKYDSLPIKGPQAHEASLRILLHTMESIAARYGRSITPMLSLSIDFYIRVFVRVNTSPLNAKFSASKQAMVYSCVRCGSFSSNNLGKTSNDNLREGELPVPLERVKFTNGNLNTNCFCENCGGVMKLAGPFWAAALHDKVFVDKCIKSVAADPKRFGTSQRMTGMLSMAQSELDTMLCMSPSHMANIIHTSVPKNSLIYSAIVNAGYSVSETHTEKGNFKTNAPFSLIWDIYRAYVAQLAPEEAPSTMTIPRALLAGPGIKDHTGNPVVFTEEEKAAAANFQLPTNEELQANGTGPGMRILCKPSTQVVDFTFVRNACKKVVMFYDNPEENWGPKSAAGVFAKDENLNGDGSAKNVARALGEAQKEKALANQFKKRKANSDKQDS